MKTIEGLRKTKAVFKRQPQDFLVEEVLPFPLTGSGNHTYLFVEKIGLSTFEAVDALAELLGRPPRDIGYAGLKDKHAVTRQHFSIEGEPQQIAHPQLRILSTAKHQTKLKVGKLYANKFTIVLREVGDQDALRESFEILCRRGVPNYFGPQRFGAKGNNHEIGAALLRQDYDSALSLFLKGNGRDETYARRLKESMPARQVWLRLRRISSLMLNALQSILFNKVLDLRIETFDKLLPGDLAMVGNRFTKVSDPAEFGERVKEFEVSPSGPLFGRKAPLAEGEPGGIERGVLAAEGLSAQDFEAAAIDGYRRPLRLQLIEPSIQIADATATLEFTLRKGGYATAVLGQLLEETI